MIFFSHRRRSHSSHEQGYVLITMLLAVSLMAIVALAVLPSITFTIQRDREQEMIHRGVQYSRAIRNYYKKFGRYPTRLEDLDNTNNLRYLRKHYKDPISGQDFKLLHFGEPGLTLGASFGGGVIPGANPIGSPNGPNGSTGSAFGSSTSSFGGGSSFGGSSFGGSSFGGSASSFGNNGVNSSGVFSQSSSFGGNSNGAFGANSNAQANPAQPPSNTPPGSDPTQASTQVAASTAQGDTSSSGQQIVASGPIVGVASVSKKATIREFNKKKKYNEWQFVYDPTADRGGLITTPYQPALQGFGSQPNLNGQPGSANGNPGGSSFGNSFGNSSGNSFGNSFGQPGGVSNNPNPMGGQTPPAQPPSTSPQQQ